MVNVPLVDLRLEVVAYLQQLRLSGVNSSTIDSSPLQNIAASNSIAGNSSSSTKRKKPGSMLKRRRFGVAIPVCFPLRASTSLLTRLVVSLAVSLDQATNCCSSVLPSSAVVEDRPSMIVF